MSRRPGADVDPLPASLQAIKRAARRPQTSGRVFAQWLDSDCVDRPPSGRTNESGGPCAGGCG